MMFYLLGLLIAAKIAFCCNIAATLQQHLNNINNGAAPGYGGQICQVECYHKHAAPSPMGPTVIAGRMVGGPGRPPSARPEEPGSQTFALGLDWSYIGPARTHARTRTRTHGKTSLYYYYYKMCAVVCAMVCAVVCVVTIAETPVFMGISLCRAVCRWLCR